MHDTTGDERPPALRPFDKTTFNDLNERLRPAVNALKAGGKGFYNQHAVGPLLQIAAAGVEHAHRILAEDPASFGRDAVAAVADLLRLLDEARDADRARLDRIAEINFDSQIETAASGLAEAGKALLGRELSREEYAALKASMRDVFQDAKRTGAAPDPAALTGALSAATAPRTDAPRAGATPAASTAEPDPGGQTRLIAV